MLQWWMNWTGSGCTRSETLSPVWNSVTGDPVTSIVEWVNPNRKRSNSSFRKAAYPCGNAGIGRLLLIMESSFGLGALEPRPSSRQTPPPAKCFEYTNRDQELRTDEAPVGV